jgi:hypothetical protein
MPNSPQPSSLYTRQNCHGFGFIKSTQRHVAVSDPGEPGVVAWWAGKWWSWQHPITDLSILERHMERALSAMVSIIVFLFALGGGFLAVGHCLMR